MKKYLVTTKKQLSTLALGCALIASTALALVNCTDPAPTKYTVSFNMNGGEPAVKDNTVEKGKLLKQPSPDPSKEGYSFAGWYKDKALTQAFNFSADNITANITLYARWVPEGTTVTYTVSFNMDGGTPAVKDNTVEKGKTPAKPSPNPSKAGYSFAGWYKDKDLTQAFDFNADTITANTTLYAKWADEDATETYTVTFNLDGGLTAIADKTVATGMLLTKPTPNPTKAGYTFAGWYKDERFTQAFDFDSDKITANITLYAKWTTATYTVTFNSNGGLTAIADKAVEIGMLLTKPTPNPTKAGYTFAGWYKDERFTQAFDFDSDKITANITLYAKWTTATYTVTFNSNGGLTAIADKTVETGMLLTKPTPNPTKAGYTFAGWYKDERFTQAFDFDSDKITANITLYAKWTTATYTVTFNLNGGLTAIADKTVETGMLLTKPTPNPTKAGYTFAGWYKDERFTQAFDFDSDKITANITLYAKWTTAIYTVTFNSNGGANIGSQRVENEAKASKPTDPTKSSYTFLGWYKDEALTQAFDFNTEKVTANTTLYAKWRPNLVDIPDDRFRAFLKVILSEDVFVRVGDKDKLNSISDEVTGRTTIDTGSYGIKDLTGIEYFTALEELICQDNMMLTSLDVSKNIKLTKLICDGNQLTNLDVSKNTALEELYCHNNLLTSLTLLNNINLTKLSCTSNQLTRLDVSKNVSLTALLCSKNQLNYLDMRGLRSIALPGFSILKATSETNAIEMLKVHENLQDNAQIRAVKTTRGDKITISTYSATTGSTSYTAVCNDYDPTADDGTGGKGVCNDAP